MTRKELRAFGFGGQGIITLANLMGQAVIEDGKEVIMTEEYSPYITGGWSRADLIISDEKIDYPMVTEIDYLVTLSQEGLDTNIESLSKDGIVLVEGSMVDASSVKDHNVIGINARERAELRGTPKATNIIMLGFLNSITRLVAEESLQGAVAKRFPKFKEMNLSALEEGYQEGLQYA